MPNRVGPAPAEVIRIAPDDSWDLIVGEPRVTPEGLKTPLSGLGAGFGNPFAGYFWSMCVHEGWLYLGTFDSRLALRYSTGEHWPEKVCEMFKYKDVEEIIRNHGGCDLWRTRDGRRWLPVTQNGFNNYFNYGVRNMISSPEGLFVGMANPYAPDVAVKRVAGWNYEANPMGGLEIWMGLRKRGTAGTVDAPVAPPVRLRSRRLSGCDAGVDPEQVEEEIEEFYGNSGFRHFGYWGENVRDAGTACENLMDEILAFVPVKEGKVADIGCGSGATTRCLLKHFSADCVAGVAVGRKDLLICRENLPQVDFRCMKRSRSNLSAASIDLVVWAKGLDRPNTGKGRVRECFGVLKPGGQLVCFDVVCSGFRINRTPRGAGAAGRRTDELERYRNLLCFAGFEKVQVVDVTSESVAAFARHRARYFGLRRLAGEIDDDTLEHIQKYFIGVESSVNKCLLATALKPGQPG